MAGPGGREVGRISIRALPDTSDFSTSLQRYLDRVERRAQVRVKIAPDMSGFTADLRSQLSQVRARLQIPVLPDASRFADRVRADLGSTRLRVAVPVEPDTRRFTARVRADLAGEQVRVQVPVTPDTSEFEVRLLTGLDRVRVRAMPLPVVPDLARFRSSLRAGLRRIRESIDIKVEPDFRGFQNRLRFQMARANFTPSVPVRLVIRQAEILRLRRELANINPPLAIPVRFTEERGSIGRLRDRISALGNTEGLGGQANGIARLAAAAAAAIPQIASLALSLAQIAPAAAVGATAVVALAATTAALKIGTMGVGDALKYAFDPSQAEKFNEALAKLTPNAQKFVVALKGAQPQFTAIRKAVQERLFEGLGEEMTRTGEVALPVLRKGLVDTAGSLNAMGRGVLTAARSLAQEGTLGKALAGANRGLSNLRKIPGQFVTGLTQIAVAAAPAFDRLTKSAGTAATGIAKRIEEGLESGRLTEIIDRAIDKAKQLVDVFKNVGSILKNVFSPAAAAGGDFLSVLKSVTGELAKVTGSSGVQDALKAVFKSLGEVGKTAASLLGDALKSVAPAVQELAAPFEKLVKDLADGLRPILKELGPILQSLAKNIGRISEAVSPLLAGFGELVGVLLGSLKPILDKVGEQLALIAESANKLLGPALKGLRPLIEPITDTFGELATIFIDIQNKLLKELQPAFARLGEIFAEILPKLQPFVDAVTGFVRGGLKEMLPILDPIIEGIGELALLLANGLGRLVEEVVIPAIEGLTALLKGDFSEAWAHAKTAAGNGVDLIVAAVNRLPVLLTEIMVRVVAGLRQKAVEAMLQLRMRFGAGVNSARAEIALLPGKASAALSQLGARIGARATTELLQLRMAATRKISETVSEIRRLPAKAAAALSGIGRYLFSAGSQLIQGMINGVRSRALALADSARSVIRGAINSAKSLLKIHSPSRVFRDIGHNTIAGFINGLEGDRSALESTMRAIIPIPGLTGLSGTGLAIAPPASGGAFEGALVLDSGEFLGYVRGEVSQQMGDTVAELRGRRRR